jgi:hypothetical protein
LPDDGDILDQIPIIIGDPVPADNLTTEDEEQFIDDPSIAGVLDLQSDDLEINQLRSEIR